MIQSGKKSPLNITLVYRSPNSAAKNNDELIKVVNETKRGSVIFGDFNMPKIGNPDIDAQGKQRMPLLEATDNKFLEQIVDFKTHVKGGLLDLVFTDLTANVLSIEDIGNLSNSDHSLYY